ncbi:ABC transporter permease [Vallitalea guaymasensis]|uniref:ABC transporter permease n=1 Tax=Vallitalea guaymasensis TaxID=1185412 RepID=UPI000DE2D7DB|nr:ABC transporter permease [Vallitalea guaymasensis]
MSKKIFMDIYFEKKRFLIIFFVFLVLLLTYGGVQYQIIKQQTKSVLTPDINLKGKSSQDGVFHYWLYHDVDGLSDALKELYGKDMSVYKTITRNLYYIDDRLTFQSIYYVITGVEDKFFQQELKNSVAKGRLPRSGEKEVVIGPYSAKEYNLGIGDLVNLSVTLEKDIADVEPNQYKVVGILDDNVEQFKSSIMLSIDTYETLNDTKVIENEVLVYFKNNDSINIYKDTISEFTNMIGEYNVGSTSSNFRSNNNKHRNIIINIFMMLVSNFIIVFLLISYLMKGLSKKIGLLKALGLSNRYINKIFVGGLSIVVGGVFVISILLVSLILNAMNSSATSFLGYEMNIYSMDTGVIIYMAGLCLFIIIIKYVLIKLKTYRIYPMEAMVK